MENDKIKNQNLERKITEELKESFLSYSMSVIIDRALPDVRDGLKPVHRRILWAMWDSGLNASAKLRKSANVVGEVLGRYHPHGDMAVYDAMARLAQDFSVRYPLIQGQGNWGSIDGDSPAAMRYTECRMGKIAEEMLFDIEKETVDWKENYDSTRLEPKVLPAKIPQLLVNGTMGIAVGMATAIPPHNLGEVVDAVSFLIDNPKAEVDDLVNFVKGPDFPTGGIIYNKKEIAEAYASGRGAVTIRAVAEITERRKEKSGQFDIVISEIPYQVNKSELIRHMAELVVEKKIEGIKDIRDESDKDGLRIVVELKNDVPPQKILNQLFKHTDLQKNFNLNMIALVDGQKPELLSLKEILSLFISHRVEAVTRRTRFDLKKAKEREHILLGLAKALSVIDKVIAVIKKSKNREEASANLIKTFKFTELQASAILDMRLQSLASLERQKIEDELAEKKKLIARLEALLKSPAEIRKVIKTELSEIKEKYGDERRTKLVASGVKEFSDEDLIPEEEAIITFSAGGYIKRLAPASFKSQKRGGKGLIGSDLGEEDMVSQFLNASTHDNILFFTDKGKVFQTKVYEIPVASRVSKGKAIANFLEIPPSDKISAIVAYSEKEKDLIGKFLVMATRNGVIKKTSLEEFKNVRRNGIIAINLKNGDELKWVELSSGKDEIIITTVEGQAIRFKESDVRPMGRASSGVIAIKLKKGDKASSMDVVKAEQKDGRLLAVMENGYGKQTPLKEYKVQKRGGSGIRTASVTIKTGKVVASKVITDEEELFALSAHGQIIKTEVKTVRVAGRSTQGVRIMNVSSGDKVAGIVCL